MMQEPTMSAASNIVQTVADKNCQLECGGDSETERIKKFDSEDSTCTCVDENFNAVGDEKLESAVGDGKCSVDLPPSSFQIRATAVDDLANFHVAGNLAEPCGENTSVVLPEYFGVDVTSDGCHTDTVTSSLAKQPKSDTSNTWNNSNSSEDEDGLMSLVMSPIPYEELVNSDTGNNFHSGQNSGDESDASSCTAANDNPIISAGLSPVGGESCTADITSTIVVDDECSHVLLTEDVEHRDNENVRGGRSSRFVARKQSMPPARFMSSADRKTSPVPLPRSNTFRTKSTGEVMLPESSRNSIPVHYETCSSILSKVCQTMALGDDCESKYTLPRGVDFSSIYVDHKTVDEWHNKTDWSKNAAVSKRGDSGYDILWEEVSMSDGYNRLSEFDSVVANGSSPHDPDYDVLAENIWDDDADELVSHTAEGIASLDSDYDVLREVGEDDLLASEGLLSDETAAKSPGCNAASAEKERSDAALILALSAHSHPVEVRIEKRILFSCRYLMHIELSKLSHSRATWLIG